jgi:hypothetical protein
MLYAQTPAILALQRTNMTQAITLGGALIMGDETGKVQRLIEADRKQAFHIRG